MASVELSVLKKAITRRKDHMLSNLDTLTMKQFRAMLEEDLDLPEKSLRIHKDAIEEMVDQMVTSHKEADAKEAKIKATTGSSGKQKERDPAKKAKAEKPARQQKAPAKKQKRDVEANKPAAGGGAAGSQQSKAVEKMKKVCRQAGIKVPPNIYRAKTGLALEAAFESLLEKHDLNKDSASSEISAAAKRLQKEKDLEGIDTSNIVEGGRRSRARVDYSAVMKSQVGSESDSEQEENEDEDSESSSSGSEADSDAENVQPSTKKGKRKLPEDDKAVSEDSEEKGDDSEGDEQEDDSDESEEGSQASQEEEEADEHTAVKIKKASPSDPQKDLSSTGKRKKAKVKAEPTESPVIKVNSGLGPSPKTKAGSLGTSDKKARQPLQERNLEPKKTPEPDSSSKVPQQSRRMLTAWSEDDD